MANEPSPCYHLHSTHPTHSHIHLVYKMYGLILPLRSPFLSLSSSFTVSFLFVVCSFYVFSLDFINNAKTVVVFISMYVSILGAFCVMCLMLQMFHLSCSILDCAAFGVFRLCHSIAIEMVVLTLLHSHIFLSSWHSFVCDFALFVL